MMCCQLMCVGLGQGWPTAGLLVMALVGRQFGESMLWLYAGLAPQGATRTGPGSRLIDC